MCWEDTKALRDDAELARFSQTLYPRHIEIRFDPFFLLQAADYYSGVRGCHTALKAISVECGFAETMFAPGLYFRDF
jgi:hypothetical protein